MDTNLGAGQKRDATNVDDPSQNLKRKTFKAHHRHDRDVASSQPVGRGVRVDPPEETRGYGKSSSSSSSSQPLFFDRLKSEISNGLVLPRRLTQGRLWSRKDRSDILESSRPSEIFSFTKLYNPPTIDLTGDSTDEEGSQGKEIREEPKPAAATSGKDKGKTKWIPPDRNVAYLSDSDGDDLIVDSSPVAGDSAKETSDMQATEPEEGSVDAQKASKSDSSDTDFYSASEDGMMCDSGITDTEKEPVAGGKTKPLVITLSMDPRTNEEEDTNSDEEMKSAVSNFDSESESSTEMKQHQDAFPKPESTWNLDSESVSSRDMNDSRKPETGSEPSNIAGEITEADDSSSNEDREVDELGDDANDDESNLFAVKTTNDVVEIDNDTKAGKRNTESLDVYSEIDELNDDSPAAEKTVDEADSRAEISTDMNVQPHEDNTSVAVNAEPVETAENNASSDEIQKTDGGVDHTKSAAVDMGSGEKVIHNSLFDLHTEPGEKIDDRQVVDMGLHSEAGERIDQSRSADKVDNDLSTNVQVTAKNIDCNTQMEVADTGIAIDDKVDNNSSTNAEVTEENNQMDVVTEGEKVQGDEPSIDVTEEPDTEDLNAASDPQFFDNLSCSSLSSNLSSAGNPDLGLKSIYADMEDHRNQKSDYQTSTESSGTLSSLPESVRAEDTSKDSTPSIIASSSTSKGKPSLAANRKKGNGKLKLIRQRNLKTGYVYDVCMSYHANLDPLELHPEDPRRIYCIYNTMYQNGLLDGCVRIPIRKATKREVLAVHDRQYYKMLKRLDSMSKDHLLGLGREYDSMYFNVNSLESALYSAGGVIRACEAVIKDKVQNAFAIVRPPGHHAEADAAMGFCVMNNVVIASRYCKAHFPSVERILIVDWDIHFGNGTQHLTDSDPDILYISLHRYEQADFYPNDTDGRADYTGSGSGVGRTVNIPWPCDGMTDADYIYAFQQVVMPIAMEFAPSLVIVSAGFDAALGDHIGLCKVTPAGYSQMTHMLKSLAEGRLVMALEGGYNLKSITSSAFACMTVLKGGAPAMPSNTVPSRECVKVIKKVKEIQAQYWKSIRLT